MQPPIEGRKLLEPILVEDGLNGRSVLSLQPMYSLSELDFHKLQRQPPLTTSTCLLIFSAVAGFSLGLAPKFIAALRGEVLTVTAGEYYTVLGGAGLTLILYVVGCCMPNDRKATMKKIKKYFKDQMDASNSQGGTP